MIRNNLLKILAVTASLSLILSACTLPLPPIHQAVNADEPKDNNQSNAFIETAPADPVKEPVAQPDGNNEGSENNNATDNNDNTDSTDNTAVDNGSYEVTQDDYLKFVQGDVEALVTYLNTDYLMFEEKYTYGDMIGAINANVRENWFEGMQVVETSYAFIDCGNDGVPEMALHVILNDPSGYEQMDEYYIFKYFNDTLCIIDSYYAYYRSMGMLNKYGVYYTYGSSGANMGYQSYERCNKNGIHEFIYSCSSEFEIEEATIPGNQIPSEFLPDDYPLYHDEYGKINCYTYSFETYDYDNDGDPSIYDNYLKQLVHVFDNRQGEIVFPEQKYMDIYNKAELIVTDWSGLEEIMDERLEKLGISKEEITFPTDGGSDNLPAWNILEEYDFPE